MWEQKVENLIDLGMGVLMDTPIVVVTILEGCRILLLLLLWVGLTPTLEETHPYKRVVTDEYGETWFCRSPSQDSDDWRCWPK